MWFLDAVKNIFKSDDEVTPSTPSPSQTPDAIQAAAVAWSAAQSVINAEETQQSIYNPKAYVREKIAEAKNTFQEFASDPFWEIVDAWKKVSNKLFETVDKALPWTPMQDTVWAISSFWSFINEQTKPLQDKAYTYLNDFSQDLREPKDNLISKFAWDFIYNNLRPLGAEKSTTFQDTISEKIDEWKMPWYKDAWYSALWFIAPAVADIPTSIVRAVTKYDERESDQIGYAGTALEAWLNLLPWVWLYDDVGKKVAPEIVGNIFTVWKKKLLDSIWTIMNKIPGFISDPIELLSKSIWYRSIAWLAWEWIDVVNKNWTNIWSSKFSETKKIAPQFDPNSIEDMLQLNTEYSLSDPESKKIIENQMRTHLESMWVDVTWSTTTVPVLFDWITKLANSEKLDTKETWLSTPFILASWWGVKPNFQWFKYDTKTKAEKSIEAAKAFDDKVMVPTDMPKKIDLEKDIFWQSFDGDTYSNKRKATIATADVSRIMNQDINFINKAVDRYDRLVENVTQSWWDMTDEEKKKANAILDSTKKEIVAWLHLKHFWWFKDTESLKAELERRWFDATGDWSTAAWQMNKIYMDILKRKATPWSITEIVLNTFWEKIANNPVLWPQIFNTLGNLAEAKDLKTKWKQFLVDAARMAATVWWHKILQYIGNDRISDIDFLNNYNLPEDPKWITSKIVWWLTNYANDDISKKQVALIGTLLATERFTNKLFGKNFEYDWYATITKNANEISALQKFNPAKAAIKDIVNEWLIEAIPQSSLDVLNEFGANGTTLEAMADDAFTNVVFWAMQWFVKWKNRLWYAKYNTSTPWSFIDTDPNVSGPNQPSTVKWLLYNNLFRSNSDVTPTEKDTIVQVVADWTKNKLQELRTSEPEVWRPQFTKYINEQFKWAAEYYVATELDKMNTDDPDVAKTLAARFFEKKLPELTNSLNAINNAPNLDTAVDLIRAPKWNYFWVPMSNDIRYWSVVWYTPEKKFSIEDAQKNFDEFATKTNLWSKAISHYTRVLFNEANRNNDGTLTNQGKSVFEITTPKNKVQQWEMEDFTTAGIVEKKVKSKFASKGTIDLEDSPSIDYTIKKEIVPYDNAKTFNPFSAIVFKNWDQFRRIISSKDPGRYPAKWRWKSAGIDNPNNNTTKEWKLIQTTSEDFVTYIYVKKWEKLVANWWSFDIIMPNGKKVDVPNKRKIIVSKKGEIRHFGNRSYANAMKLAIEDDTPSFNRVFNPIVLEKLPQSDATIETNFWSVKDIIDAVSEEIEFNNPGFIKSKLFSDTVSLALEWYDQVSQIALITQYLQYNYANNKSFKYNLSNSRLWRDWLDKQTSNIIKADILADMLQSDIMRIYVYNNIQNLVSLWDNSFNAARLILNESMKMNPELILDESVIDTMWSVIARQSWENVESVKKKLLWDRGNIVESVQKSMAKYTIYQYLKFSEWVRILDEFEIKDIEASTQADNLYSDIAERLNLEKSWVPEIYKWYFVKQIAGHIMFADNMLKGINQYTKKIDDKFTITQSKIDSYNKSIQPMLKAGIEPSPMSHFIINDYKQTIVQQYLKLLNETFEYTYWFELSPQEQDFIQERVQSIIEVKDKNWKLINYADKLRESFEKWIQDNAILDWFTKKFDPNYIVNWISNMWLLSIGADIVLHARLATINSTNPIVFLGPVIAEEFAHALWKTATFEDIKNRGQYLEWNPYMVKFNNSYLEFNKNFTDTKIFEALLYEFNKFWIEPRYDAAKRNIILNLIEEIQTSMLTNSSEDFTENTFRMAWLVNQILWFAQTQWVFNTTSIDDVLNDPTGSLGKIQEIKSQLEDFVFNKISKTIWSENAKDAIKQFKSVSESKDTAKDYRNFILSINKPYSLLKQSTDTLSIDSILSQYMPKWKERSEMAEFLYGRIKLYTSDKEEARSALYLYQWFVNESKNKKIYNSSSQILLAKIIDEIEDRNIVSDELEIIPQLMATAEVWAIIPKLKIIDPVLNEAQQKILDYYINEPKNWLARSVSKSQKIWFANNVNALINYKWTKKKEVMERFFAKMEQQTSSEEETLLQTTIDKNFIKSLWKLIKNEKLKQVAWSKVKITKTGKLGKLEIEVVSQWDASIKEVLPWEIYYNNIDTSILENRYSAMNTLDTWAKIRPYFSFNIESKDITIVTINEVKSPKWFTKRWSNAIELKDKTIFIWWAKWFDYTFEPPYDMQSNGKKTYISPKEYAYWLLWNIDRDVQRRNWMLSKIVNKWANDVAYLPWMIEYANILKKFLESKQITVSVPANWWYVLSTRAIPTIDNVIRLPQDIWFEISDSGSFKFKSSIPEVLKSIQVPWQLLYNDIKVSKKLQWDVDRFYSDEIEDWLERSYQEQQLINRWMAWVLANEDLWYFRLLRWSKSKAKENDVVISEKDYLSKTRWDIEKFPFIRISDTAIPLYEAWVLWVNNQQAVITWLVNYVNNRGMNIKFWANTKFNSLTQEDILLWLFATSEQEYEANTAYLLEKAWVIDAQQAANILSNVWVYSKLRSKKNIVRQLTRARKFWDLNQQRKTPNWTQLSRIVDLYISHRDEIQSWIWSSEFDETWLAKNIVSFLINLDWYYNQNLGTRQDNLDISVDQVKEILTKSEDWDSADASIETESKYTMVKDFLDVIENNLSVVQVSELNPKLKLEPDMFVNKSLLKIASYGVKRIKIQSTDTLDIEKMFWTNNLKEVYKKITGKSKSKVSLSDITYEINKLNKMKLSKRKKISKEKLWNIAAVIWNKNVWQWLWWLNELRVAKWINIYDKWNPENINAERFEWIKLDSIPKMKMVYTIITWLETTENSFDKLKELLQSTVFNIWKEIDGVTNAIWFINWNDVKVQENITTLDNRIWPIERSYNSLDLVDYVQSLVLDYNKIAWMRGNDLTLNYTNMEKIKDDWFGPSDRIDAVRSIVKDILSTYAESFESLNLIGKTIDWIKLDYISKQKIINKVSEIISMDKNINEYELGVALTKLWLQNRKARILSKIISNTQVNKTKALLLSPIVEEFKKLAWAFDIVYQEKWEQDLDVYAGKIKTLVDRKDIWDADSEELSDVFDTAPESIARSWEDDMDLTNLNQFPALRDALDKWRVNTLWNRNSYYRYPWYIMARDRSDKSKFIEIEVTDFFTLEKRTQKIPPYKLYKIDEFKKISKNWKVETLDYDEYIYRDSKRKNPSNIYQIVKDTLDIEQIRWSDIPYFEQKKIVEWLISWEKFIRKNDVENTNSIKRKINITSIQESWLFDASTIKLISTLNSWDVWSFLDPLENYNIAVAKSIEKSRNTNNPCKI